MPSSRNLSLRSLLLPLIALVVVVVDQLTKSAVRQSLATGSSIPVLDGVFHLTRVRNSGGAFGLLPGGGVLFFAASGIVIGFIITYYLHARPSDPLILVALGLELGGAVGNLIDRFSAGVVTDFLDFRIWPVFNIADSSLVMGIALLAFAVLLREWQQKRRPQEDSCIQS